MISYIIYVFYIVGVTAFTICLHLLATINYIEEHFKSQSPVSTKVQYDVIIGKRA